MTSVLLTHEPELRTMTFKTNTGQRCKFGRYTGSKSKELFVPEGKRLAGLKGTYGDKYISSVALLYE